MTTLSDLTQRLELLCEKIDDLEGEIPNGLLELFAETNLEHTQKVDNYLFVLDRLRRDSAYYSQRSAKILQRAKTCESLEKAIKERLKQNIIAYPDLPWKSSDGDKLRVQENPESLVIEPLADIPIKYFNEKTVISVDREKIKEDLKNGVVLEWAKLERGTHLRIY